MSLLGDLNWVSLFIYGSLAIVMSWATSGCRVGNNVLPQTNPDTHSGFYLIQPQTLTLYMTTRNPEEDTQKQQAPLTLIPEEIGQVFTNPVALLIQNLKTGEGKLVSPKNKQALPIYLNKDSSLTFEGQTAPSTFWVDPACASFRQVLEGGKLTQMDQLASPPGTSYRISGQIEMTIQWISRFRGNCVPTFAALAKCYQDPEECGGSNATQGKQIQSIVVANFEPFVQSQLITPAGIANMVNYAYEVSYR